MSYMYPFSAFILIKNYLHLSALFFIIILNKESANEMNCKYNTFPNHNKNFKIGFFLHN